MFEFTGERVIPGEVDSDLWNEHFSRYAFAARLSGGKCVLDVGCGTGYGTAEFSRTAAKAVGLDISRDALDYARLHYPLENVRFLQASCTDMPFREGSFDLVVAFEVIEHLGDWRGFLIEVHRVLAAGGQCVISTPNKNYYTESRGHAGANVYHGHEFTFDEFRQELLSVFPHVSLFLQNHAEGVVFQPANTFSSPEARVESGTGKPEESHFFLAVCALAPQPGPATFLYLPKAANILRERERHIQRLDEEIALKNQTIAELVEARDKLIEMLRRQKDELEERNRWAADLNQELEQARALIGRLQEELNEQARGYEAKIAELEKDNREKAEGYEAKVAELEKDNREKAEWAIRNEQTADERTKWALDLDRQVREIEGRLSLVRSSRWFKLGNTLGMGPRLRDG